MPAASLPLQALLFDFDGLILDTEEPIYLSYREIYQQHGLTLPFEQWVTIIGTTNGDYDPLVELQSMLPQPYTDLVTVEARRAEREMELILEKSPQPGIGDMLELAKRLGLKLGVASSSSAGWVKGHLRRLGLLEYFDCIRTSGDVSQVKPDPELYLKLLDCLQVAPHQAVAFEDSAHGVTAARRAGLFCVAIPNRMTAGLCFDHANLRVASLAELPLDVLLQYFQTPQF